MGRGLAFEGIDVSFGLSLPGKSAGRMAPAAPLGWSSAAALENGGAHAAALDWDAAVAPFRQVLGDFLPDEGFSSAELPFEALAGVPESGGSLLRAYVRAEPRAGAPVRDFCLRLGRPFIDPDCPAGAYRKAAAECRSLYDQCSPAAPPPGASAAFITAAAKSGISAFLLEFPLAFAYGTRERRHLDRLVRDLAGLPLAIAFFNPGWYSLRVIEALREKNIGLCLMDFPSPRDGRGDVVGSAPPRFDMATSSLAYLKFHGFSPDRATPGELEARIASWIPRIEALALQAQTLRVVFQGVQGQGG